MLIFFCPFTHLDCFLLKYYTAQRWNEVCKESRWMLFFRNSTQSLQLSTRIAGKCHIFEQNNVASRDGEHHLVCPCVVPRRFSPSPCYRYISLIASDIDIEKPIRVNLSYFLLMILARKGCSRSIKTHYLFRNLVRFCYKLFEQLDRMRRTKARIGYPLDRLATQSRLFADGVN